MMAHEKHLRNLYEAISSGATGADLAGFFHSDAEQIEYPSLMRPTGHRRSLAEMIDGSEMGARIIRDQRYDVLKVIESGDEVAVQFTWTATVAMDLPTVSAGTVLVAHVAAFYEFRDGLMLRQSSYDCYEPLPVAS
jgi:ketosteroid isomerase-like protein